MFPSWLAIGAESVSMELILEHTAYEPEQMPELAASQVALAGRSNVGKSSLINRLAGRKSLARISSTPGKTRSVNFYRVRDEDWYLVDLPGYGYARVSKKEREKWSVIVAAYMKDNPVLKAVVLLIDCRLDPQAKDLELLDYVRGMSIPLIPVLTKADKCKQSERDRRRSQWRNLLEGGRAPLLVSARTGMGTDKLAGIIRSAALGA
jgi:GTP-binding protein